MNTFSLYNKELCDLITMECSKQLEIIQETFSKSNSLGSHNPEHLTFPANKMFPKEISKQLKDYPYDRKEYKRTHSKRSRRYNKNISNFL